MSHPSPHCIIFTPGNGGTKEGSQYPLLGALATPGTRNRAHQCLPLHFAIATLDVRLTFVLLDNLNETRRMDCLTTHMVVLSLRECGCCCLGFALRVESISPRRRITGEGHTPMIACIKVRLWLKLLFTQSTEAKYYYLSPLASATIGRYELDWAIGSWS
jgi:hypothetical protein